MGQLGSKWPVAGGLGRRSLAVEWGRYGIRLNAIAPGVIPTEGAMSRLHPSNDPAAAAAMRNPLRRVGRPEELDALITFLLAPGCAWLNGELISLDGGESLANGASTTEYLGWTDQDWATARERVRATDARDKSNRSTEAMT